MDKPSLQVAVSDANRRVDKTCRGEIRREIDLDADGNARTITWLFFVPACTTLDHPRPTVRLPLVSARWGARVATTKASRADVPAVKPVRKRRLR